MVIELNGFKLELTLCASRDGKWVDLPLPVAAGDIRAALRLNQRSAERIDYTLEFQAPFATRLRLRAALLDQTNLFHLIHMLVVNSDLKVKNVDELVALSKAQAGKLNYLTPGAPMVAYMEWLKKEQGADCVRVPFGSCAVGAAAPEV